MAINQERLADDTNCSHRTGLTNLAERGVGVCVLMTLERHSNMVTKQCYIDLIYTKLEVFVELV